MKVLKDAVRDLKQQN